MPSLRIEREGHSTCVLGSKVYVMAGHDGSDLVNAVECFQVTSDMEETQNGSWNLLQTNGSFEPRQCPLVCALNADTILMSGGFDSKTYYSDAYLFNTKTERWSVAIEHNYRNEGFSCFDAIQVAPGHVIALVRDSHKQPHAIEYK